MGNDQSCEQPNFPFPPQEKKNPFKIGKYTCVAKLGKGAFGSVYKGYDEASPGESFALKIQRAQNQSQIEMVLQEINQHRFLDHPSIVRFIEAAQAIRYKGGLERRVICMVLEYVDGASLADIIDDPSMANKTLPLDFKVKWSYQTIQGVNYLHHLGKVHRDLKPPNLLISRKDLNLKIADFGLSRDLDNDGQASTICGTPMYMAPEIQPGRRMALYGKEIDIWSLGIILYELILDLKISREFNKLTTLPTWEYELVKRIDLTKAPKIIWDLICKCLRTKPSDRIKIEDLMESPVVKIYSLMYGLIEEDQADEMFREMVTKPEDLVTVMMTVENIPDPKIKEWVMDACCTNIDIIPLEALLHQNTTKALTVLSATGMTQVTKFQNLIKIKKRRSKTLPVKGTPTVSYPEPSSKKFGWYWKGLPSKDGSVMERRFMPLPNMVSSVLEKVYLSSVRGGCVVIKTHPPPTTVRGLASSSEDSDDLFYYFDVENMSAKELDSEKNYELKRYAPKGGSRIQSPGTKAVSATETAGITRKFQFSTEDKGGWISFGDEYQELLGMAYENPKIEAVVLNKGEKCLYVVNFKNLACYSISKNEIYPLRYIATGEARV